MHEIEVSACIEGEERLWYIEFEPIYLYSRLRITKITDNDDSEKYTEIKYIFISLYWTLATSIQNGAYRYTYMVRKRIKWKSLLHTITTALFLKELPTCTRKHFYQGFFNPQHNNTTTDTASARKLCGISYFGYYILKHKRKN